MIQNVSSPTKHASIKIKKQKLRQQIEIVNFISVLHDVSLDLGGIDPSDKVLHVSDSPVSEQNPEVLGRVKIKIKIKK